MEYNPLETLEGSLCASCIHRVSRLIEPMTEEFIDYVLDKMGEEGIDDDVELLVEQHMCLVTGDELDGIVHDCNKYTSSASSSIIRENIYLR